MEYWSSRLFPLGLLWLSLAVLSFSFRFRKVRVIEEGENLSPRYFPWLRAIGLLFGAGLFLSEFSVFGGFLVTVCFGIFKSADKMLGAVVFFAGAVFSWSMAGRLGAGLRRRLTRAKTDAVFSADPVIRLLLKDVENGADTVLLFRDRLEGIRSFSFDVDGYNHAAFSAIGCKELALFINGKAGGAYRILIMNGYAGEGSGSLLNKTQNGARYRFSHIRMERKTGKKKVM